MQFLKNVKKYQNKYKTLEKKKFLLRTIIAEFVLSAESFPSSPGGNQVGGLPPVSREASLHTHEEQSQGSSVCAGTGVRKCQLSGDQKLEFGPFFFNSFWRKL